MQLVLPSGMAKSRHLNVGFLYMEACFVTHPNVTFQLTFLNNKVALLMSHLPYTVVYSKPYVKRN
jgi:hypothetical protein